MLSKKILCLGLFVISFSAAMSQVSFDSVRSVLKRDDVAALVAVLEKTNIDSCYQDMYTLLSESIRSRAVNSFELLLKKGADVNKSCNYKLPVYMVCKYGNLEMLQLLERYGADLNPPKYEDKYTLAEYAAKYDRQEIVSYLKNMIF